MATRSTPTETVTNLICFSFFFFFGFVFDCLYKSIANIWNADFLSYHRGSFFIFCCCNNTSKAYVLNFALSKLQSVIPQLSQNRTCIRCFTAQNTVISPNFLVWKFCEKAQFPHSFGQFARNYTETAPFHKISAPGN